MRKEITEFVENSSRNSLSSEADKLLNEITLVQDTIHAALLELGGITSLKGDLRLEMKSSTAVIQELAGASGSVIFEPSDFSPYHWLLLTEEMDGSASRFVLVIQGTKWEVVKAWEDTQIH